MIKNQDAIKKELNDFIGASTDPKAIAAQVKISTMLDEAGRDQDALEARTIDLAKKYRESIIGGVAPSTQKDVEPNNGTPQPIKKKSFDEIMKDIIDKRPKA